MPSQDIFRPDNHDLAHAAVRARLGVTSVSGSRMRLDLIGRRRAVIQVKAAPPVVVIENIPVVDFAPFDFFQPPSMKSIARLVALKHDVSVADMRGNTRRQQPTRARHEAMVLIYSHMRKSTIEIGRFLGGRDHTTVIAALRKHVWKRGPPC